MPEGIYVTTSGAPAQKFTMDTQTYATGAEKEIYYRKWKKCGFLCFKKTYYVDYRTEVGQRDVFTQRVRADNPIAIELVGYSTGQINVSSQAEIGIAGKLTNESGLVSLTSKTGAITQLSGGAAVNGNDLRFKAVTGIGTQGSPVNVITGNGSFTAVTTNGNVAFQSLGGALRINEVSTTGKVWLFGDEDIVGVNPSAVHVKGSSIEISAPRGGIGTFNGDGTPKSTLNIQTEDSPGGGITAYAAKGIALKQSTGNLWVNQVASKGGDVYIEAGGDLIDNNRNETRDLRTEAELLALWNAAALQGDSAEESRQLTLANTRKQFLRYWGLRNAKAEEINATTGAVTRSTADAFDPNTYAFTFTTTEKAQLAQSGLSTEQITSLEAARTQELKDLHALYGATHYQINPDLIITEVNTANALAGRSAVDARSTWTDKELKSPLPKAIFSKSSTDTQTRIEAPNVVGNRVVLKPGGKIGRDDGSVIIDLRKAGGLTVDDQLTIMSAEADDMVLDKTNWKLTVLKKDTFNVLSNRLNVTSNGFVYLGADATDDYPNGGDANLEQVNGKGEIRIKVSGSILNASTSNQSVLQGYKAILEAATGSIGSAAKPLTMTLTGDVNRDLTKATLVARAKTGMWINQTGDIRIADVYSPANVNLTAAGAIIDARGNERTRSVEADEATLVALNGSVGTEANPIVVKMGSGGVNATSSSGRSVYLRGADSSGLTVNAISSGLDIDLYAPTGNLRVRGQSTAVGRIDAQTEGSGDFTMDSGAWLRATTGDIYVSADDAGLSQLDASRAVVVVAQGAITDTSTDAINVNAAGRTVTLSAKGSIGTLAKPVDVLTKERTKLVATSRDGNAYLGSDLGIMRISQVSAKGDAFLSSAYAILDERGTRAQAVDATNVGFRAGGDVGQAAMPMTVKTAATGVVTQASATGSVYLKAPLGVLTVKDGSATNGEIALDGSTFGLVVDGTVTAKNGLSLTAGTKTINLTGKANLSNDTGRTLVQSDTITMLDGARLSGGAGTVVMSATNNITLTGVSSSNATAGAIVVSTTRGSVIDAGDTNAYDLRVTSDTGGIQVTSYGKVGDASQTGTAQAYLDTDAPVLNLTNKMGEIMVAQTRATRDVQITAKTRADLLSQGSVVGTKVAALGGDATVTSALGGVKLTSLTSTRDITVQAAGKIDLTSASAKQDLNLKSLATVSGAGVQASTLTATRNANITVLANQDAAITQSTSSLIQSLTASAGAITVDVAGTLDLRNARSALDMTLLSKGNAVVGSASSTRGFLNLKSTGGSLQASSLSAATQLTLDSRTSINAGSLSAKTDLSVTSQSTAIINDFKVTAGGADFNIGSHFTLTSGTATGLISVDLGGWGSLGTLTSSRGALTATSGLGMRFNALKAGTGITLLAHKQLGYGVDAAYALIGNSVDGGTGSVKATADTGDIKLGRLAAKQASTVTATSGKVNVSAVSLPKGVKLNVSASGTKTLPAGYQ
ncbi:MAG: hypothetical protein E6Q78_17105 [Rhodoferax sp.]|nr:MAG: hypothetical protein E6Q78_17105 [Rhodoferax sp.]